MKYSSEFIKLRNGKIRGVQTVTGESIVSIVNQCSKMKAIGWINVPKVISATGKKIG